MRTPSTLAAIALVATVACQTESPQQMQARIDQESTAFKQMLTGVARRWEAWTAAGQADSVAAIFMEQGHEMPPNEPAVVGRAAIRARQATQASWGTWAVHITPAASMANGPLGVDRGTFTITFKPGRKAPAGMTALSDAGSYMVHWHQVGGQWLIADLIWNSDKPLPAAPKPRTPARRPAARR
jgi:ketosteroid isomerase-like protein